MLDTDNIRNYLYEPEYSAEDLRHAESEAAAAGVCLRPRRSSPPDRSSPLDRSLQQRSSPPDQSSRHHRSSYGARNSGRSNRRQTALLCTVFQFIQVVLCCLCLYQVRFLCLQRTIPHPPGTDGLFLQLHRLTCCRSLWTKKASRNL